jgi:predicted hotdog family 3-hydroxylacyl-ACP dehydratase
MIKEEIGRLLPHGESMCLLDTVEDWDEVTISCRTSTHRDRGNPLLFRGCLTVSSGLEYAAQAMGLHVGLLHRQRRTEPQIGYVGAVRDVIFAVERLDDLVPDLLIAADKIAEGVNSYMYRFAVTLDGRAIIEGRASIFLKDRPT